MQMTNETTIPVDKETHRLASEMKKKSDARHWDDFLRGLIEENTECEIEWDEVDTVETGERVEMTRTAAVGILEAVEEMDMKEDVLDIIETLSQPDLLAKNREIVDHLIERSMGDEQPTKFDRLLANIVVETEQERSDEQSPAGEIAHGLLAEHESTRVESRCKKEHEEGSGVSARSVDVSTMSGNGDLYDARSFEELVEEMGGE